MERKKVRETMLNSTLSCRKMGVGGRIVVVVVWMLLGFGIGSHLTTRSIVGESISPVPNEERRAKVKDMFMHAWGSYKKVAWAHDELKPVSETASDSWGGWGITLVDTLDTLIIMGLTDELADARKAVEMIDWSISTTHQISTFETTIRHLGGLLSAYTLTNDTLYLQKSIELADKLLVAFQTRTGFPAPFISTLDWSPVLTQSTTSLAEVGSLQLEFSYLSLLTGNTTYALRANRFYELLWDLSKTETTDYPGLWPLFFDVQAGEFQSDTYSIGGQGDSTYEYFLKLWMLDGQQQPWLYQLYNASLNGIKNHLTARAGRRRYITAIRAGIQTHTMDHLSCFAPGMIALGAWQQLKKDPNNKAATDDLQYAESIAETCYIMYKSTPTKIGPEIAGFEPSGMIYSSDTRYQLRPETIESFFILYRITSNQKYRDWSWELLKSIEAHCRTEFGYTGLTNVDFTSQTPDDVMQSFFLAETLKYLYLIFSDSSLIPLDEYIFSTEAHPFRIQPPT
eukprot:TRINITY_DN434_c0_g1_i1.p1 TRINITY_DN434_c0_g1~~TRINITY_DN434_c0_g1_i1.p1  ORF type:complete len:511 (+),score=69.91 TRINITY_DN434_c0_g1_i1:227-1759(+)